MSNNNEFSLEDFKRIFKRHLSTGNHTGYRLFYQGDMTIQEQLEYGVARTARPPAQVAVPTVNHISTQPQGGLRPTTPTIGASTLQTRGEIPVAGPRPRTALTSPLQRGLGNLSHRTQPVLPATRIATNPLGRTGGYPAENPNIQRISTTNSIPRETITTGHANNLNRAVNYGSTSKITDLSSDRITQVPQRKISNNIGGKLVGNGGGGAVNHLPRQKTPVLKSRMNLN